MFSNMVTKICVWQSWHISLLLQEKDKVVVVETELQVIFLQNN